MVLARRVPKKHNKGLAETQRAKVALESAMGLYIAPQGASLNNIRGSLNAAQGGSLNTTAGGLS